MIDKETIKQMEWKELQAKTLRLLPVFCDQFKKQTKQKKTLSALLWKSDSSSFQFHQTRTIGLPRNVQEQ